MSQFSIIGGYTELRPAFTGQTSYAVTISLGINVTGLTFTAALYQPGGTSPATGSVTVAVGSAATGVLLLTLPGQTNPGEYTWTVTDGTGTVWANGVLDVTGFPSAEGG